MEAVAAAEAVAAVESAADALGAEAALSPELPKEPGDGADGMAEDAEEIPGRPEVLKTRGQMNRARDACAVGCHSARFCCHSLVPRVEIHLWAEIHLLTEQNTLARCEL